MLNQARGQGRQPRTVTTRTPTVRRTVIAATIIIAVVYLAFHLGTAEARVARLVRGIRIVQRDPLVTR